MGDYRGKENSRYDKINELMEKVMPKLDTHGFKPVCDGCGVYLDGKHGGRMLVKDDINPNSDPDKLVSELNVRIEEIFK